MITKRADALKISAAPDQQSETVTQQGAGVNDQDRNCALGEGHIENHFMFRTSMSFAFWLPSGIERLGSGHRNRSDNYPKTIL
ncbi:MAG: hypothetical protein DHS20C16_11630 [Phycisphaerae bacterium]|nr:MAG: hypothetical protein DHS20C16_11630 [Phycisphaerae bacterium]